MNYADDYLPACICWLDTLLRQHVVCESLYLNRMVSYIRPTWNAECLLLDMPSAIAMQHPILYRYHHCGEPDLYPPSKDLGPDHHRWQMYQREEPTGVILRYQRYVRSHDSSAASENCMEAAVIEEEEARCFVNICYRYLVRQTYLSLQLYLPLYVTKLIALSQYYCLCMLSTS